MIAAERKIGLALSGGGFRAAFFHVGVLARLAELGVLPRVEVISTVSGGSIVGAAYYIRLRRLLESKPDAEIDKCDYVNLVAEVELLLREAVRKNIRARVLTNPLKNLEMLVSRRYSRSDRIGDLYDRHLYKKAWTEGREEEARADDRDTRSWGREKQIEMRELLIEPEGEPDFDPDEGNASRQAKVPILLLNATSLNTGHNWRFEAVRMGEPLSEDERRAEVVKEVDKNMRLEQGYFPRPGREPTEQPLVPESQEDFPLGLAVAASACVPGVFHPLAISDMYQDDGSQIRVQLVDGGVQDNQGVQALVDRRCDRLIVSDASGQLKDANEPSAWLPRVLGRTVGVAGDRIRDEQLSNLPEGAYALMHLRKGLDARAIPPIDSSAGPSTERLPEYGTTDFGVDPEVQRALSLIRTDLDFFTDTEALSLELDGYLMSKKELAATGFEALGDWDPPGDPDWAFSTMAGKIGSQDETYLRRLQAGRRKFLRLFRLRPRLASLLALAAIVVAAAVLGAACFIADALDAEWPERIAIAIVVAFLAPVVWANLSAYTAKRYGR